MERGKCILGAQDRNETSILLPRGKSCPWHGDKLAVKGGKAMGIPEDLTAPRPQYPPALTLLGTNVEDPEVKEIVKST